MRHITDEILSTELATQEVVNKCQLSFITITCTDLTRGPLKDKGKVQIHPLILEKQP